MILYFLRWLLIRTYSFIISAGLTVEERGEFLHSFFISYHFLRKEKAVTGYSEKFKNFNTIYFGKKAMSSPQNIILRL